MQTNNIEVKILYLNNKNGFITPIKASTLWAYMVWWMSIKYGNRFTTDFINDFKEEPFFYISDAFPQYYIPIPYINYPEITKEQLSQLKIRQFFKRLKKHEFVHVDHIYKLLNLNSSITEDFRLKDIKLKNFEYTQRNHNRIAKSKETEIYGFNVNIESDLWQFIRINNFALYQKYKIEELLQDIYTNIGYGKRHVIGYGIFNLEISDKNSYDSLFYHNKNTDLIMTISDFIPKQTDPKPIGYKLTYKLGKLAKTQNPFKKPLIFIKSGSVFKYSNLQKNLLLGQLIENIAIDKSNIALEYAIGFPIYLRSKDKQDEKE